MATIISHSIAALAVGKAVAPPDMPLKFWIATAVCAALPDLYVVSFAFDIPYGDMLGHRGITHSLPFALALALVIVLLFFREAPMFAGPWWLLVIYFFVVTASHAVLDALTNGGLGVLCALQQSAIFLSLAAHRSVPHWSWISERQRCDGAP